MRQRRCRYGSVKTMGVTWHLADERIDATGDELRCTSAFRPDDDSLGQLLGRQEQPGRGAREETWKERRAVNQFVSSDHTVTLPNTVIVSIPK